MSVLLCDVGGTHIRFALAEDNPLLPHKTRVDQYSDLQSAILSFLASIAISPERITIFYLAFSNRNEWNTDTQELRKVLPNATIRQINDFEANAYGVMVSDASGMVLLNKPREGSVLDASRTILGVGTGLGLAYIFRDRGIEFVQRTHGAHMLPAFSPEHDDLYRYIVKDKTDALIYEDMLTGRGLYKIYEFLSARNHLFTDFQNIENLMQYGKENAVFHEALVMFHRLLGIFCHQAVAFGYAYGGIYLTGGVLDRLVLAGLFDVEKFMSGFMQDNVPIVARDVKSTPVYWIKDEFVSLKGLQYLAGVENA